MHALWPLASTAPMSNAYQGYTSRHPTAHSLFYILRRLNKQALNCSWPIVGKDCNARTLRSSSSAVLNNVPSYAGRNTSMPFQSRRKETTAGEPTCLMQHTYRITYGRYRKVGSKRRVDMYTMQSTVLYNVDRQTRSNAANINTSLGQRTTFPPCG